MEDPYALVVSAGSPLARRRKPPSLKEVAGLPLIGFRQCRSIHLVENRFRDAGLEPKVVFRSDDNGTIQGLVAAGVGAALVPLLAVDPGQSGTAVLPLDVVPPRLIAVAWHRDRYRPPAALAFVEQARALCAQIEREQAELGRRGPESSSIDSASSTARSCVRAREPSRRTSVVPRSKSSVDPGQAHRVLEDVPLRIAEEEDVRPARDPVPGLAVDADTSTRRAPADELADQLGRRGRRELGHEQPDAGVAGGGKAVLRPVDERDPAPRHGGRVEDGIGLAQVGGDEHREGREALRLLERQLARPSIRFGLTPAGTGKVSTRSIVAPRRPKKSRIALRAGGTANAAPRAASSTAKAIASVRARREAGDVDARAARAAAGARPRRRRESRGTRAHPRGRRVPARARSCRHLHPFAQTAQRPGQPRFHRAAAPVERFGGFLLGEAEEIAAGDHEPVLFAEPVRPPRAAGSAVPTRARPLRGTGPRPPRADPRPRGAQGARACRPTCGGCGPRSRRCEGATGRKGAPGRKRPRARKALTKPSWTASSASAAEQVIRYAVLNAIVWCSSTRAS